LDNCFACGGMLAFALSFDEVIVTTVHGRPQQTLADLDAVGADPTHQRPVTNVVAVAVIALTALPILAPTTGRARARRSPRGEIGGGACRVVPWKETSCSRPDCYRESFVAGTETPERVLNPKTEEVLHDCRRPRFSSVDGAVTRRGRGVQDLGGDDAGGKVRPAASSWRTQVRTGRVKRFAALEALNCGKPRLRVLQDEMPGRLSICFRFFAGAVRAMAHGAVAGEYWPGTRQWSGVIPLGSSGRSAMELSAHDGGMESLRLHWRGETRSS